MKIKIVVLLMLCVFGANIKVGLALETQERKLDDVTLIIPGIDGFHMLNNNQLDVLSKLSNKGERPHLSVWFPKTIENRSVEIVLRRLGDDGEDFDTARFANLKEILIDGSMKLDEINSIRNSLLQNGAVESSIIIENEACDPQTERIYTFHKFSSYRHKESGEVINNTIISSVILVKERLVILSIKAESDDKEYLLSIIKDFTDNILTLNPDDTTDNTRYSNIPNNTSYIEYTGGKESNQAGINYSINHPAYLTSYEINDYSIGFKRKQKDNEFIHERIVINSLALERHPYDQDNMSLKERSAVYADALYTIDDKFYLKKLTGTIDRERTEVAGFPAVLIKGVEYNKSAFMTLMDYTKSYYICIGRKCLVITLVSVGGEYDNEPLRAFEDMECVLDKAVESLVIIDN